MPRITIALDENKIIEQLVRLEGYNPEASPLELGNLKAVEAARGVARNLFTQTFKVATKVLVAELKYEEDEFECVASFVGEFDVNRLPLNIDIWANDRLAWYDSEAAMNSPKPEIRDAKINRIAIAIASNMQRYVLENLKVEWKVNCWPHLTPGVYYQTPTGI